MCGPTFFPGCRQILNAFLITTSLLSMPAWSASWASKAAVPTARANAAAAVIDSRIFVIGGYGERNLAVATVEEFDSAGESWRTRTGMATARHQHGAAASGGKIYVFGGYSASGGLASSEMYDPAIDRWTARANLPKARWGATAATVGDAIYLFGGFDSGGVALSEVLRYDPATDRFTAVTRMPTARSGPAVAVFNGKVYVAGGFLGATGSAMTTMEIYDPATDRWQSVSSMTTKRLGLGLAAGADGKIYAFGGDTYFSTLSSTEIFDPATGSWNAGPALGGPRRDLAYASINGKIFALTGGSAVGTVYSYSTRNEILDTGSGTTNTSTTGFNVVARDSGTISSLTLDLDLTTASGDIGRSGNIYLGAQLSNGAWYLNNGSGWLAWGGGAVPAYFSGTLPSSKALPVVRSTDMRGLAGARIFAGYGLTSADMLSRGLIKQAYTIPSASRPTYSVMTNPTDSEWLKVASASGSTIRYFGTRNGNGIPQTLDKIQVIDTSQKTTSVTLGSNGRPSRIRSPDGVTFELSYVGSTQVNVTATSADGATKVSTSYRPGTASAMPLAAAPLLPDASGTTGTFAAGEADWTVQVRRCGVPTDGLEVWYSISVPGWTTRAGAGTAVGIGGGNYVATIPTGLKPSLTAENLRSAAESIASKLGTACDALNMAGNPEAYFATLCPAIAVALTTVTGPGGVAIGAACSTISAAVLSYCKVLGEGGVLNNASLAEQILQGLQDPKVFQEVISLRADTYVTGLAGTYLATADGVPTNGPFPSRTIDIDDQCKPGGDTGTKVYSCTETIAGVKGSCYQYTSAAYEIQCPASSGNIWSTSGCRSGALGYCNYSGMKVYIYDPSILERTGFCRGTWVPL